MPRPGPSNLPVRRQPRRCLLSSGAAGRNAFRRFALAPWIERLGQARLLKGALALVTSAIVGVIANLSAWFALQVLFHALYPVTLGPIRLALPVWASFDWRAGIITIISAWLILARRWNVILVLPLAAAGGWLLSCLA